MRDDAAVQEVVKGASAVFHLAAQVAVTTSLLDPADDLQVNLIGTFNLLQALRRHRQPCVFASTNKVYGKLDGVDLVLANDAWTPTDTDLRAHGISEQQRLDFRTPYGCSKGAADQYVLDYASSFDIPTAVLRMSCIYGPRQLGTEDQGWVAHFLLRALQGQPITLYGDGMQVRDLLFIEDLVRAFRLAQAHIEQLRGQAFNIGGGPERTVSLLELLERIARHTGRAPEVRFEDWRTGDQRYYVSDTRKFQAATGWAPQVGVEQGVSRLHTWLGELTGERPSQPAATGEALEAFTG
jgi:CDP-paratose 2-epimerase